MKRKSTEEFIIDAYCKHGDKYNYKLVEYTISSSKVDIICPVHGVFKQVSNKHLRGQGCNKCAIDRVALSKRRTSEEFIQEAYCEHGDDYNYKLVDYKNNITKVTIICPVHGIFEQAPKMHLNGQGCPKCRYIKMRKSLRRSFDGIIHQSHLIHNGKYEYYDDSYSKIKDKVDIICPIHGVFRQRFDNHLNGQGCPKCASFISRQEIELQEWLSAHTEIKTNNRSLINPYELDIIIPSKKIAIEYNGLYWHSESMNKGCNYHLNKYNLCKDKGYRLIQVWENEWLLKRGIVKSIILSAIGKYQKRVHGRKCVIKEIPSKDARLFYDDNHIQGFYSGTHHGLYYNNDMVSLMTIKTYKGQAVLERFVNKTNTIVHGAFSKLLNSFGCDDIITFTDLRYFTGDVYRNNGFNTIHQTKPNYWYFKNSTIEIIHRRSFQKKKIKDKFHKGLLDYYNKDETETVNMIKNNYHKIWDCGNIKFQYKNHH